MPGLECFRIADRPLAEKPNPVCIPLFMTGVNMGNTVSVRGRLFDVIDDYNLATTIEPQELQAELLLHCREQ